MKSKMESVTAAFLVIFSLHQVSGMTYCPPLRAPSQTNVTCITPAERKVIDCSTTWLPDGTVAYYECVGPGFASRFGKVVCKGNYKEINGTHFPLKQDEDFPILPCGIRPVPSSSDFHFYDHTKSPHYPILNFNEASESELKGTDPDQGQSEEPIETDFRSYALKAINAFRVRHDSPPLEQDDLLTEKAQAWAEKIASKVNLELASENFVGQTVFSSDQNDVLLAVNDAIQFWYNEGLASYDWTNIKSNWDKTLALDFSQIVWKSTRRLGIGAFARKHGGVVVLAFYFPVGNIVLEDETEPEKAFVENVQMTINHDGSENEVGPTEE